MKMDILAVNFWLQRTWYTKTVCFLDSYGNGLMIWKAVGGRDHSTVVHGIKKVGDDISTDTSVERLVATIRKKINPH